MLGILCGYDPTLCNSHSFRSGAATSAGKALVEDHMIKMLAVGPRTRIVGT